MNTAQKIDEYCKRRGLTIAPGCKHLSNYGWEHNNPTVGTTSQLIGGYFGEYVWIEESILQIIGTSQDPALMDPKIVEVQSALGSFSRDQLHLVLISSVFSPTILYNAYKNWLSTMSPDLYARDRATKFLSNSSIPEDVTSLLVEFITKRASERKWYASQLIADFLQWPKASTESIKILYLLMSPASQASTYRNFSKVIPVSLAEDTLRNLKTLTNHLDFLEVLLKNTSNVEEILDITEQKQVKYLEAREIKQRRAFTKKINNLRNIYGKYKNSDARYAGKALANLRTILLKKD